MVGGGDVTGHAEEFGIGVALDGGGEGVGADGGVGLHDFKFAVGELAGLEEDGVGDADLADVVEGAGVVEGADEVDVDFVGVVAEGGELFGEDFTIGLDAFEVGAGFGIARFGELGQGDDGDIAGLGFAEVGGGAAEFQLCRHAAGEDAQGVELSWGGLAGLGIDNAEGAQGLAVAGDQGRAGVEADVRGAGDEGIVVEARVLGGVGNDEYLGEVLLGDDVGAKGDIARGVIDGEADTGFEPLAVAVHEGDQGDGGVEDEGGEFDDVVEFGFGGRVEDIEAAQGGEAEVFGG